MMKTYVSIVDAALADRETHMVFLFEIFATPIFSEHVFMCGDDFFLKKYYLNHRIQMSVWSI
jgi:hypothetical protein